MIKRSIAMVAACALLLALSIAPVVAKKPTSKGQTTKMTLKLDDHSVDSGAAVTGTVKLTTTKGKKGTPISGATLKVQLDGVDHSTLTTNSSGEATLNLTGVADGEHTVKVTYDGTSTYKGSHRTQGFTVGEPEEEEPEPSPSPSV